MFLIPQQIPWTQQPQVFAHVADADLDCLFYGSYVTSKARTSLPDVLVGSPILNSVGLIGCGVKFSGGLQRVRLSGCDVIPSSQGFTIEILCAVSSVPSLASFMSTGHYASGGNARGLIAFGGAGKNIYFWGSSADLDSGVAWREDGAIQHVFCVSQGGSGTPMLFYRDGRLIASGTTPAVSNTPSSTFVMGDSGQGWTQSPVGIIFKSSFYRRALSAIEVRQLSDNPWQIFTLQTYDVFIPSVAGGGPTNITGTLSSTLDSISTAIQGSLGHSSTLSISLDTIAVTGSGVLNHIGTSTSTLDDVVVTFSGAVDTAGSVSGTLACTLDNIVFSSAGNLNHSTTISITLDDVFVSLAGTVAGTPENIDGTLSIVLDGIGFTSSGNSGTYTLTEADIDAIVAAIQANPKTLTVPKFLGLK